VEGGTRFTWTEDIRLAVPVVGELAARCYRPVMRMLMGRAMEGLRRYVIAIGPGGTPRNATSSAASTRS
jgi:hypothetical protein